jgi:N-acetylglucosaminyl-diphospho-decaprenol L-rhamnosyltransferase
MDLLIVILNYRTVELTIQCLRSIFAHRGEVREMRVVVVDNGSADGSVERIEAEIAEQRWGDWCEVLALPNNVGFAAGNNRALQRLGASPNAYRYVLLLNSDTVLHAGTLRKSREIMETGATIGMMSCRLLSSDGATQNVTRRFPTPLRQMVCAFGLPWIWPGLFSWADVYDVPPVQLEIKRDCDWIGGAYMFIRAEALQQVGLLDESFFFYGEDIEFCHRFHQKGFRIHYDPSTSVTHIGGSSSDPMRMPRRQKDLYMWQSRYRVQRKCYGRYAAALVRCADVMAFAMRKMKLLLSGRRGSDVYRQVSDSLRMLVRPLHT